VQLFKIRWMREGGLVVEENRGMGGGGGGDQEGVGKLPP